MGAVVLRFAMNDPKVSVLKDKFHVFISIAGPHLGSTGSDSTLVGIGQWALTKWKKIKSLSQLGLEDETLLELSESSTVLSNFKTIVLISSADDSYVPSFSARMEVPSGNRNPIIELMQRNLYEMALSKVPQISKVEMSFEFNSSIRKRSVRERVDTLLGRAAHIQILDSLPLTLTLLLIFGEEWFD